MKAVIDEIARDIVILEGLMWLSGRLGEIPHEYDKLRKRLTVKLNDIENLRQTRRILRETLGHWTDHAEIPFESGGIGIVRWKNDALPIYIEYEAPVDDFLPLGNGCFVQHHDSFCDDDCVLWRWEMGPEMLSDSQFEEIFGERP